MTDKQPEALRLADELEGEVATGEHRVGSAADCAAAELRRLHEANEELKKKVAVFSSSKAAYSLIISIAEQILDDPAYELSGVDFDYEHTIHDKIKRLHEVNAELVEALGTVIRGVPNTWDGVQKAKVVLDKAKESNHG